MTTKLVGDEKAVLQRLSGRYERQKPLKSVVIRLSVKNAEKSPMVNGGNDDKPHPFTLKTKWRRWFKYWPFRSKT